MEPLIQIGQTGLDLIHIIAIVLALILLGVLVWLNSEKTKLAETLERERDDLADAVHHAETLSGQIESQRTIAEDARIALAKAEARSAEDEKKFAELAQVALDRTQARFMDLAKTTFEKHNETAKGSLKELMQPIGKNLDEFAKRVGEIEKVRAEDKSAIQEQVKAIGESLKVTTSETNKLVTALSAPKGAGRWGETTLRNVMEHAGLSPYCDFSEQVSDTVDGKNLRPDVVIKLPGGREIVVDSKVSLEDYLKSLDATDPVQRTAHLKAHGRNVREHIRKLGGKAYQDVFSERVDFVALFIPGESFYVAALEHEPDLFDFAASKQVIVVTPSTLLALAKAVAYGWRQEQATENARHAAELGRELYGRLVTMGGHVERMGKSLNSAVDSYNKMGGSLNSRVLPTARKFQELQIGDPDKNVPEIEAIETRPVLPERTGELNFDDETG